MMDFAVSTLDAVLDRSPQELMAALLVAVAMSALMSRLFAARRARVSDPTLLVTLLVFGSSLSTMVLTAGYLRLGAPPRTEDEVDGPFNGYVFEGRPPAPFGGFYNGFRFHGAPLYAPSDAALPPEPEPDSPD